PQGQFPAAQWAILATPNGEKVVRWADLAQEIGHFRLRARLENTADANLPPEALRLARDLLDKQIVDTHGAKVVRVNDLQLAEHEGQLRLVGADMVEEMTADERVAVFQQLDLETAAETMAEVEPEMQAAIVSDLPEERAADILEEMDPDEAADLLQDLPEERREELVELMEKEEKQDVEELLTYAEDSAGGIMTTDYVALAGGLTAAQAIDELRVRKPDP